MKNKFQLILTLVKGQKTGKKRDQEWEEKIAGRMARRYSEEELERWWFRLEQAKFTVGSAIEKVRAEKKIDGKETGE